MRELPRVLLFDLDDTLLVYGSGGGDPWRDLAVDFIDRLDVPLDPLVEAIDVARKAFWLDPATGSLGRLDMLGSRRTIVGRALVALDCDRKSIGDELADAYTWYREGAVAPLPGAVETLEALRARGHRLGLVTNGGRVFQRRKIERFDLAQYFDDIRVEGEQGLGKPHPQAFERALAALDARPEEAWMVGDNLSADIGGAQALGIRGVWVDAHRTGLPEEAPAQPDRIVEAVSELLTP
jgi:putative hydrolase of the HAD superfamily